LERASRTVGNSAIAKAQLDALRSESEILAEQLAEYEALKSGAVEHFKTDSLSELPGVLVKARIAKGLSQRQLAERLGLKEQQIQRYEAENYDAASLRRILEVADALGLHISKHAWFEPTVGVVDKQNQNLDRSRFPLAEMYRRGWFSDFSGSLRDATNAAGDLLTSFLSVAGKPAWEALHRKHVRSGSTLDDYALLAWQCRILWRTQKGGASAAFSISKLTPAWIRNLTRLSAKPNGPVIAQQYLREAGIILVMEPHLPQTYLDGAALMFTPERAVIGMTLRYDRLDNFWFVLLHEVAHLVLHCQQLSSKTFFDDLDAPADELETHADNFASASLLPDNIWETAMARYLRTPETVNELANQLGINPAIIAGKIRKESENYIILNELVGIGEVRRQFPEVKYGQ